jgi:2-polyprenyl-3-methyl-5-hydroxy-6-metoxy-1,4-benzoquinol methylase
MDAAYAEAYPDLYRRHWWWRVREEILLRRIGALLDGAGSPRILDVGCGAALFFDALARYGRVEGIESDPIAIENSGRWRDRITVGNLDGGFRPAAPYDLILMLDLLEHIPDPVVVLNRARELLTATGHVLITVPAFQALWTAHDELNHHVMRYSASTLRALIGRSGLAASHTEYLFQSLVVPKLLVRAKEAITGARPTVPGVPSPPINSAVQAWFRAEHAVANWMPFGGSLLAVARRRDG